MYGVFLILVVFAASGTTSQTIPMYDFDACTHAALKMNDQGMMSPYKAICINSKGVVDFDIKEKK